MRFSVALAVLVLALLAPRAAAACAVVTAQGAWASVARERAIVVWDERARVEHLVRELSFEGDAADVGCLVVTPAVPEVARVDSAPFDALERTAPAADAGASPADAASLTGFESAVLRATTGADGVGDWLRAHGYADRPAVRAWIGSYLQKGWAVVAMRFSGAAQPGRRTVRTATVRLTFPVDAPFYPYTEPERDIEAQAAFQHRYHATAVTRVADVWVVAPDEVQATGNFLQGLPVERAWPATAAKTAAALGDTSSWRFDPRQRSTWTVTHMHEALEQRVAFEDLRFAAHEEEEAAKPAPVHRRDRTTAIFFLLLALGLGAVVVASVARLSS